jgi:NADH:ubiquinone oxidoreductase subunit K
MNPFFAAIIALAISSFLLKRNIVNYLISSEIIMLTLAMLFSSYAISAALLIISAMEAVIGVALVSILKKI